jgi:hypothetical protein
MKKARTLTVLAFIPKIHRVRGVFLYLRCAEKAVCVRLRVAANIFLFEGRVLSSVRVNKIIAFGRLIERRLVTRGFAPNSVRNFFDNRCRFRIENLRFRSLDHFRFLLIHYSTAILMKKKKFVNKITNFYEKIC